MMTSFNTFSKNAVNILYDQSRKDYGRVDRLPAFYREVIDLEVIRNVINDEDLGRIYSYASAIEYQNVHNLINLLKAVGMPNSRLLAEYLQQLVDEYPVDCDMSKFSHWFDDNPDDMSKLRINDLIGDVIEDVCDEVAQYLTLVGDMPSSLN